MYRRDQHKTLKLLQAPEDQRIVAKDNLRPEMKESVAAARRCRRAEQRCREVWRMQEGRRAAWRSRRLSVGQVRRQRKRSEFTV